VVVVTPFVVLMQVVVIRHYGIHRAVGKYLSFYDLGAFFWASITWLVPMLGVRALAPDGPWRIPISVSLMDTLLALAGILAIRVAQRTQAEGWQVGPQAIATPVLLVGAGAAGVEVARELRRHDSPLRVLGFVDDDPGKDGAVIAGSQVLGTSADIPDLVQRLDVDHVIVSIADAGPGAISRIVGICETIPIRVRTIPSFKEIIEGSVAITKFRDVELEDLLGRDPVNLDPAELRSYLDHRVVMVTGAGGSIGSELARQVAQFNVGRLLLVEQYEGALFEIHRELIRSYPRVLLEPLVADITDQARMRSIFERFSPDVVVHAAAHKHVAMMEVNAFEAVKNNTFGTQVVAELAGEYRASSFVLVSTDKAVRPSSVMGATKRLAEMVVQLQNDRFELTKFIAVRFGNVLGSSGSVVPIFKDQIAKGGPVTVTDVAATRYFMTIPEASRLVLTAGVIGNGGEVMVLDMGEPVRIIDLARSLITLSGYVPDEDIPIELTGLKPGEKLTEELYAASEEMELTRHPRIFVGQSNGHQKVKASLVELAAVVRTGDESALRATIGSAVADSKLVTSLEANGTTPVSVSADRPVAL
jgi:FlaA1/EpsC-like NDP-sugar epimerase